MAGLVIFPAACSVGIAPDSGPSLIFITLPHVFSQAFGNMPTLAYVVSLIFYALLALAALTTLISLHEVSTSFFYEELKISRRKAALIVTVSTCFIGALCSLSRGACPGWSLGGRTLFDWFDYVTGQIFLPIGGFLTCLFVGWYLPKHIVREEFTNWGTIYTRLFPFYLFLIRVVCPLGILAIFLYQMGLV